MILAMGVWLGFGIFLSPSESVRSEREPNADALASDGDETSFDEVAPLPDIGSENTNTKDKTSGGSDRAPKNKSSADSESQSLLEEPFIGAEEANERVLAALEPLDDAASHEVRLVSQDLPEAAAAALKEYEDAHCLLSYAGYLGILGDTWGCLVQGPSWVELCVIRQAEYKKASRVEVVRFDANKWEELLESSRSSEKKSSDEDISTEGDQ